jgi:hypothetical protein
MTVHAKDGDKGSPREIVYDLLTSKPTQNILQIINNVCDVLNK